MGGWGVVQADAVSESDGGGSDSPMSELKVGVLLSTIKLMQAGFHEVSDSEESVLYWLRYMQEHRYLPR